MQLINIIYIYHIFHSAVVTVHCRCPRHQEPQLLQVFEARVVVERIRGQVEALATRRSSKVWRSHGSHGEPWGIRMGKSWEKQGKTRVNNGNIMGKPWEYHG